MGIEIEHKFLVLNTDYRTQSISRPIRQGYMCNRPDCAVRVRVSGEKAWICIKGATNITERQEFEYEIPLDDAQKMLNTLCQPPLIEKVRHEVVFGGFLWEVDEFFGDNEGLVIAEIELDQVGEEFPKPDWLGKEVTEDYRYLNASLVKNPWKTWGRQD
jgi:adenylate cyclase